MKRLRRLLQSLLLTWATISAAAAEDDPVTLRVAAYNVKTSKGVNPEQIGEMFKPFKLDIIGFNEAPDGDWTSRVGC